MSKLKHTPLPWERRGFALYIPGTNKKILDVSLAWKSTKETDANLDLVVKSINAYSKKPSRR